MERVVEISLTEEERAMLAKSAKSVQSITDVVKSAS
jgi:malate dehydrogenase